MARVRGRRPSRRRAVGARDAKARFTIDASVFVNAFNPHEESHRPSLALLHQIHDSDTPVIVPAFVLAEVASAVARVTGDEDAATEYTAGLATLPQVTLVSVTPALAREAADLAAAHRLRGSDAICVTIARRYATSLVTRDEQQRQRASAVVECLTPEQALGGRG